MSEPTAYLAVAAMFALRAEASKRSLPKTRTEFAEIITDLYKWKIDEVAIEKIVRQLQVWDLITVVEDRYAGETLRLYGAKTDDALTHVSELGHKQLIGNARTGGADWFSRVFSNQQFWDDLHHDPMPQILSVEITDFAEAEIIPASDRIVTADDNRREVDILQSDIKSLVEEIKTNNEASIELGDEKDLIAGELQAADIIVSQPAFRLARLLSLVLPALRFLADKFASGAIGEMAKRIIAALVGLV